MVTFTALKVDMLTHDDDSNNYGLFHQEENKILLESGDFSGNRETQEISWEI